MVKAHVECCSSVLPQLIWAQFHTLFLEKYLPLTRRDYNMDEFLELE